MVSVSQQQALALLNSSAPRVVHFVGRAVVLLSALPVLRGRFQLPVVEAQEKHLGQLKHGLALLWCQVAELVLNKIQNSLLGGDSVDVSQKLDGP